MPVAYEKLPQSDCCCLLLVKKGRGMVGGGRSEKPTLCCCILYVVSFYIMTGLHLVDLLTHNSVDTGRLPVGQSF